LDDHKIVRNSHVVISLFHLHHFHILSFWMLITISFTCCAMQDNGLMADEHRDEFLPFGQGYQSLK